MTGVQTCALPISIHEGERAIALDPNDADGYVALAGALNLAGEPQRALQLMEQAVRLNPHYPTSYLHELGLARFGMEDYDEAAVTLERAVALNPDDRWSSRLLIAALGHLGRVEDAAPVLRAFTRAPIATVSAALLLREPRETIFAGLVAESSTYSMLQSGPEFAAWRSAHLRADRRAGRSRQCGRRRSSCRAPARRRPSATPRASFAPAPAGRPGTGR